MTWCNLNISASINLFFHIVRSTKPWWSLLIESKFINHNCFWFKNNFDKTFLQDWSRNVLANEQTIKDILLPFYLFYIHSVKLNSFLSTQTHTHTHICGAFNLSCKKLFLIFNHKAALPTKLLESVTWCIQ